MSRFVLCRAWGRALMSAVLVGSAAPAVPAVAAPKSDPPPLVAGADRPADPIAHDPTLVKQGVWFYLASSGDSATGSDYIPVKRSKDLRTWEDLPPVFTQLPAGVLAAIGATPADAPRDAWAPDLSWTGSEWRLYYSVSRFGTTNSVTALATTSRWTRPATAYAEHVQPEREVARLHETERHTPARLLDGRQLRRLDRGWAEVGGVVVTVTGSPP